MDLSLTTNIESFLDELAASSGNTPIDVLVNNVGVLLNEHQLSEEGHELSFATNLLNHYVLTNGLIERGLLADDAVIINMSSGGMYNVPLQVERLNELNPDRYDGVQAYARQKRAQVELNAWWRQRHVDRDWCFYVMHPGWVDTEGVKTSLPAFRALFQHVLRDATSRCRHGTLAGSNAPIAKRCWVDLVRSRGTQCTPRAINSPRGRRRGCTGRVSGQPVVSNTCLC